MSTTRPYGSLESFLSNAKRTLQSAIISQQQVTIVLGGVSADIDSISSSILFAYLKSSSSSSTPLTNTSINRHLPTHQYPPLYTPVVNNSAQDLKDRPEIFRILDRVKLKLDHLITLDDLETEPPAALNPDNTSKLSTQKTRLMLTGQSTLSGPLSPAFDACIVGFMDNAHTEAISPLPQLQEPRIASEAAACTSLIVNRYQMLWNTLSFGYRSSAVDSANDFAGSADNGQGDGSLNPDESMLRLAWDRQIAELAAAAILIATDNLKDREKTTNTDVTAYQHLEGRLMHSETRWNRDVFFEQIS